MIEFLNYVPPEGSVGEALRDGIRLIACVWILLAGAHYLRGL